MSNNTKVICSFPKTSLIADSEFLSSRIRCKINKSSYDYEVNGTEITIQAPSNIKEGQVVKAIGTFIKGSDRLFLTIKVTSVSRYEQKLLLRGFSKEEMILIREHKINENVCLTLTDEDE